MSSIPDEYKLEAETSEMLETCDESRMLIESMDNILDDSGSQGEKYFVVTEMPGEETNLIEFTEAEKLENTNAVEQNQIWDEICRICANPSDHLIPIFQGEGLEHEINNKIHRYLPIQVSKEDSLPLHLCYHCAATLLAWHELAVGCLAAEQRLLQMQSGVKHKQSTILDNSIDEECGVSTIEDPHVLLKSQLSEKQPEMKGESNEETTANESERSSRTQMPFKALLKRQSIFWRAFEKSIKKTSRKGVVEDDTESIWIAVTDSAYEQPSITSDPLQLSETLLQQQQDCNEIYNEQVVEKCLFKSRVQETIEDNDESRKKKETENDNKSPSEIMSPKSLPDRQKTQKVIPDIQGSYKCIECGKRFKLKDSYQRHMRIHTNERPFTCHVCAKQFRDSGGLSRHLKDVHAKLKNFSCDMCGKSFASKATREDHRRTHTGERPYICESCGNTFKSKASLYIHSKLHTDEFPHPCSYCNKKFRRRQEMLAHVTTHTGEKNHTCDVCSKRFRVKSELVRHKLVHSEDKPFVCNKCGLAFRQKRYLNNHVKSRHIDTLRNC